MSLQEFTWQQFLVAAMVLSALWVLGVWLVYWRPLSAGGRKAGDALPHGWEDEVDELNGISAFDAPGALDDGLMGKPALEHGVSVLDADEFSFAPLEERGEREEPYDRGERKKLGVEALLGELADAQEEIKGICRIMERENGSKEDFFAMFGLIKDKYPRLADSEMLAELNDFISEQVPFYLSDQELDSLWV